MSEFNWKSIFNGSTKTNLKQFVKGDMGLRPLIKNAKTSVAKSELYRLERNYSARDARRLVRNALTRF